MKARWVNIKGLDGDYDLEHKPLYFDEEHFRLYDTLCECCEKKLKRI